MKKAFSMIELIFILVILGVLAGVAIPRLFGTRDDAEFVKAKAVVSSVRTGISLEKNAKLMSGKRAYPNDLENGNTKSPYFKGVLSQPVSTTHWGLTSKAPKYEYYWSSKQFAPKTQSRSTSEAYFIYDSTDGTFTCHKGDKGVANICDKFDN